MHLLTSRHELLQLQRASPRRWSYGALVTSLLTPRLRRKPNSEMGNRPSRVATTQVMTDGRSGSTRTATLPMQAHLEKVEQESFVRWIVLL